MLETGNKSLNTYRLSIRSFAGGFSFSVVSQLDGSLMRSDEVALAPGDDATEALRAALQRPRLMNYSYSTVELLVDSPSTIVPLELFRREDVAALYRLNFPSTEVRSTTVSYEMLPSLEVVVLYSLPNDVRSAVLELFPDATVRSLHGTLLEATLAEHRKTQTKQKDFFATIHEQQLIVCAFQQGRLLFSCTYEARYDADRIYHLLAAWKSLDMDSEEHTCHLSHASSALQQQLTRYIRKVDTCA